MKTKVAFPLVLASALLALGSFAGAQTTATATTVPVGFMSYPLTTNATVSFGVPLFDVSVFAGQSAVVTSTTINVAGVNWTSNQFATVGSPFFVAITSGAQIGRVLAVTANTSNTLTLEVGDTNLDASGFAMAVGDSIDLFQGDTLGTMFGATVDVNGILPSGLKGAGLPFQADGVQIFNGGKFVNYFFNTTVGNWVNTGTTSQNDVVLYPDRGVMIVRRGANTTLTLMGRVPSTGLLTKLPPSATSVISLRFPTDTTLGGLNFSGPGNWITNNLSFQADRVAIWNGGKWVSYWKNSGNLWLRVGGDGTDQGATIIPAGTALQISKLGTATGPASFFSQTLPYSLN